MLLAVLLPILFSFLTILPLGKYKEITVRLMVLVPLSLFLFFLGSYLMWGNQTNEFEISSTLIPFSFKMSLDGLSWLFTLLITGIGTLIYLYGGGYMKGHPYSLRLFGFLNLFMSAMLGLVLSDNILSLFLFWELTSISSFFLIGFNSDSEESQRSALRALAITGGGGLILFAGLMGLAHITGTYSLSEIIDMRDVIINDVNYVPIFILILLGAMSKSAQFPFHFWLPGAMKAPTPVSAYLHSATMVKAGIYLMARLFPAMGGTDVWTYTLMAVGGVTMLYAAFHALLRTDLKSVLAYSTVSALGVMMFLLGLGTDYALKALSLFILIHALYKASLFMITGIIDHETGTRDLTLLGGLRKVMMPVAIAGLLAAISNAGIPPSIGFIGKDLIYEASTKIDFFNPWIITGILVLTNALLLVAGFWAGWKPFSGKLEAQHANVHSPEWTMWFPPLLLSALGIIFGLFPMLVEGQLFSNVYMSLAGQLPDGHLALWHGFNHILALSGVTLALGGVLYFFVRPGNRLSIKIHAFDQMSPQRVIEGSAGFLNNMASKITGILQNGYLRVYVAVIVMFTSLVLIYKMSSYMTFSIDADKLTPVTFYEAVTAIILIVAILFTVFSTSRLVSVASLSVIGLMICLIFVFYSAPDLAMTQFTVDTLTVILFVLVLYKLPRFLDWKLTFQRVFEAVVSLVFGTIVGLLALEVLQFEPQRDVSRFYADNAYTLAKGKNIVNVILVDFRGADTLIEIVVLTIAAIGVFGLLNLYITKSEIEE